MATFSWAYVDCENNAGSGSAGPPHSLQFVTESGGATTGSAYLTYYTGSGVAGRSAHTLYLTGTLIVTGAISASSYHIENITQIGATGSTYFGDDQTDTHARTGSFQLYSDSAQVFKIDSPSGNLSGSGTLTIAGNGIFNSDVGVGTSPSAPVHVYKAATTSPQTVEMMRLQVADEGVDMTIGSGPGIDFYVGETGGSNYGGTVAVVREEASDADSDAAMVFHTATDDQTPETDREKMRITSDGKVGIGTTNPSHLLTVVGAISGSSTLEIVGATTLGSTLAVSGTATLAANLNVIQSSNNSIMSSSNHNGDIIFHGNSAQEIGRFDGSAGTLLMNTNKKIRFADGGEYVVSNGTDLTVASGADIILAPAGGDVLPDGDGTRNLGSAGKRWANVYTADLHLKNDRGNWTVVEEEDCLTLRNNNTGKKYKLLMEEID